MASIKISGLTEQTTASDTDLLPVASSAGTAKRMTLANFVKWLSSKFAPFGYGLGTTAKELTSEDNLDTIWQNGNYFWNWSTPANAHIFDYQTQGAYSYMRVDGEIDSIFTQTLRSHHVPNIGITVVRHRIGDTITPWEWENPPMLDRVEYRITERVLQKPLYTMFLSLGAFYNGIEYEIPVSNLDYVCRINAFTNNRVVPSLDSVEGWRINLVVDNAGKVVKVVCDDAIGNFSGTGQESLYVQLWYVKK